MEERPEMYLHKNKLKTKEYILDVETVEELKKIVGDIPEETAEKLMK